MPQQHNLDLIRFMNRQLSNFAVLYFKLHRYHWYVHGPHFFGLHEKFEEWYDWSAQMLDELAERILAIGGRPLATMSKYLKETTLQEAEADDKEEEMLEVLLRDFEQIADELQTGIDLCEQHKDEGSADLLIGLQSELQKQAWMLRALLGKVNSNLMPV